MSYPLKRSVLDQKLEEADIAQIHAVYYWMRQSGTVVMRATFCGQSKKGWFAAGQSSITLYAVPARERKETETLLLERGLASLCGWLKRVETAGNAWRAKDRHLAIECNHGVLSLFEF
jgi:hypothetical protein